MENLIKGLALIVLTISVVMSVLYLGSHYRMVKIKQESQPATIVSGRWVDNGEGKMLLVCDPSSRILGSEYQNEGAWIASVGGMNGLYAVYEDEIHAREAVENFAVVYDRACTLRSVTP